MIGGAGLSGGIGSSISGGSFWKGFGIGVTVAAVNHMGHEVLNGGGGYPPGGDDPGLFHLVDKLNKGEITPEQYLNAVIFYEYGFFPLLGQVLWNDRLDLALAIIPGGRIVGRVIQKGGQTITKRTLRTLGLTKEQARIGVEGLKKANGLPPNFHGRITENGYYLHPNRNVNYGRIHDYLP